MRKKNLLAQQQLDFCTRLCLQRASLKNWNTMMQLHCRETWACSELSRKNFCSSGCHLPYNTLYASFKTIAIRMQSLLTLVSRNAMVRRWPERCICISYKRKKKDRPSKLRQHLEPTSIYNVGCILYLSEVFRHIVARKYCEVCITSIRTMRHLLISFHSGSHQAHELS